MALNINRINLHLSDLPGSAQRGLTTLFRDIRTELDELHAKIDGEVPAGPELAGRIGGAEGQPESAGDPATDPDAKSSAA